MQLAARLLPQSKALGITRSQKKGRRSILFNPLSKPLREYPFKHEEEYY
ncbi:hypothetical protein QWZ13_19740 [Reinekea marina]|nr:hypothetical protein [Reinekea marina]MDN3650947.1 hypothetical protein [Reinekea marina]MDN3651145.1 hypothetical protein [Reinekea marina]